MDIHNRNEDLVFNSAQAIFDEIQKSGNPEQFCLCQQCKIDTICYTLNRVEPNYIVSNRGFSRIEQTSMVQQQIEADINALIYKGLRLVNHHKRKTATHDAAGGNLQKVNFLLFDIPTITGRIFHGVSFEPITDTEVSLFYEGELVKMRNSNWQNPYTIVSSTPGAFSFWPAPITADSPDVKKDFRFSIKVHSPDFEILNHFFVISMTSKFHNPQSFALNKTYTMPDLYLFPPGEAEINEEQS